MTSATDNRMTELRKLLDERGIEYTESQDRFRTRFRFNYCEACGDYLNEIEVMGACITASKSYLTPEQAIASTLGSERHEQTCHAIAIYNMNDEWCSDKCSACDYEWYEDEPNYCPNCGAKVTP